MRYTFAIAVLAGTLVFGACSMNGRGFLPGGQATNGSDVVPRAATVRVNVYVASNSPAQENALRSHYFSRSSSGLEVDVYAHGKTTRVAHAAVDITPGSRACNGSKLFPRTCSATLLLSPGAIVDFALSDFDAKPIAGEIPKTAHLLGYGRLINEKIPAETKTYVAYLGGVVARISGTAGFVSLPADAKPHSVALVIHPEDFGNNPITGGRRDPFANPITVALTEIGGTGHGTLSLNGGAAAKTVTVEHSTDTVAVKYDGGGSAGYGMTVRLSAAKFGNVAGNAENVRVSPLIVSSSALAASVLSMKGNGDYQVLALTELGAPATTQYAATTTNCNAIASAMHAIYASPASAAIAIIGRGTIATPGPAGCTILLSDGNSDITVQVKNTYSGQLGSPVITETPLPAGTSQPNDITVGPDGNLWFNECIGDNVGRVIPSHGISSITEYTPPPYAPSVQKPQGVGIAPGPDGNLWFGDFNTFSESITKLSTTGTRTNTRNIGAAEPSDFVTGPDGALWFSQCTTNQIGRMVPGKAPTYATIPSSAATSEVTVGADGNLWFAEFNGNANGGGIAKVTPSGQITEFPTPTASAHPWGITAGPDGAIWFTECFGGSGNAAIGRIPTTATSGSDIQEFSTGMSGHQPVSITTGPDGALWFTYWTGGTSGTLNGVNGLGRMDPLTHTVTEYPTPTTAKAGLWGITAGPGGALWFIENGRDGAGAKIGMISIQTTSLSKPAKQSNAAARSRRMR